MTRSPAGLDGLLLIDKPAGPTSHDVVARVRRSSGQRQIGHTGTLDPSATGLLPLVLGKATRLASRLSGTVKTYEAEVALGLSTETDDADGEPIGPAAERLPDASEVSDALARFRGTFDQVPPRHSAKRIEGQKAYELARRDRPVVLAPARVTVHTLEWTSGDATRPHLRVVATSGFYVRALARDLGAALGCGGHLARLRRVSVGPFDVASALPLADAEALGREVSSRLVAPVDMLPEAPVATLTALGLTRTRHGNPVGPEHLDGRWTPTAAGDVRLVGPDGDLVAVAVARGGLLHPVVVLG